MRASALLAAVATVALSSTAWAQPVSPASPGAVEPTQPPVAAQPAPAPATETVSDPLERLNRGLFRVHKGVDKAVVRPVALGYKTVTPRPVRRGVRNVLNNLGEPVTFLGDVLQGQFVRAGETATRFVANTTIGVLGIFDVATPLGVPIHYEDTGQTLAVYGVSAGPYLFIPILGPTTVRDGVGRIVDVTANPVNWASFEGDTAAKTGVYVANAVDTRATLDPELQRLEETATDEYATIRSLYMQNRRAEIANGETDVEALPEFEDLSPQPTRPTPPPRRQRPR